LRKTLKMRRSVLNQRLGSLLLSRPLKDDIKVVRDDTDQIKKEYTKGTTKSVRLTTVESIHSNSTSRPLKHADHSQRNNSNNSETNGRLVNNS